MPHFRPFLSLGLSNSEEHQVCAIAVGVVGDICRALESKVIPYCDEIVALLLGNAQNPSLNRDVKPPILCCFGDIALAVGGHFEKYLPVTMGMLTQAANTEVDQSNPDLVDYLQQLREGIFEAYTGVLQGLRADNKSEAFMPYVDHVLHLARQVADSVARGEQVGDDLVRATVGVIGDLAMSLGPQFKQLAKQPAHKEYMKQLIRAAKNSNVEGTKQVGRWAHQTVFERAA
jgi:importin subunit beta-1